MAKHAFGITINNPTYNEFEEGLRALNIPMLCTICGHEGYAPGRTPHVQAAFYSDKSVSWRKVKEAFPKAHIETITYAFVFAYEYCKKEGVFNVTGDLDDVKAHELDMAALKLRKANEKANLEKKKAANIAAYKRNMPNYDFDDFQTPRSLGVGGSISRDSDPTNTTPPEVGVAPISFDQLYIKK